MKIVFRENLNLEQSVKQLNVEKVNLTTFNASVNSLETKISNVVANIDTNLKTAKEYAESLVSNLKENEIKAIQNTLATLDGNETVKGSISNRIKSAIAEIVDGAPAEFDTLKELLNLIKEEGGDFTTLVQQVNEKIASYVGNVSQDYNTLEKIEGKIKATKQEAIDEINKIHSAIADVANEIPVYQYDALLPIAKGNKVKLTHPAIGNMPYKNRAEIVTVQEDKDGNITQMTVENYFTLVYDTEVNDGVTYIISSDEDLSSSKANIEYNTKAGNLVTKTNS